MKMPVTTSGAVSMGPPTEGPAAFLLLEGSAVVVPVVETVPVVEAVPLAEVVPVVEVEVEVAVEEAVVVSPALVALAVLLVSSGSSTAFWDPTPFRPGPVPAPLVRN